MQDQDLDYLNDIDEKIYSKIKCNNKHYRKKDTARLYNLSQYEVIQTKKNIYRGIMQLKKEYFVNPEDDDIGNNYSNYVNKKMKLSKKLFCRSGYKYTNIHNYLKWRTIYS